MNYCDYLTLESCQKCKLYVPCTSPCLSGFGNKKNPKFIIIQESPTLDDDKSGYFKLDSILEQVISDRLSDIYIIPAVRCCSATINYSRKPTEEEILHCRSLLYKEILDVSGLGSDLPILITLGSNAYFSVTNDNTVKISDKIGIEETVLIGGKEYSVFPQYHPSFIARNRNKLSSYLTAFTQVFNRSRNLDISEIISIISPFQFLKLATYILNNLDKVPNFVFDIETAILNEDKINHSVIGFSFNVEPLLPKSYYVPLVLKDWTEFDVSEGDKLLALAKLGELIEKIPVIGHNIKFDLAVCGYNQIIDIDKVKVYDDTLLLANYIYNRTLGDLTLKGLSIKLVRAHDWGKPVKDYLSQYRLLKDRHNYANIPTPTLAEYGAFDSHYTRKLHTFLMSSLPKQMYILRENFNNVIPYFVSVESKGIQIDQNMFNFLYHAYKTRIDELEAKFLEMPVVKKYIEDTKLFNSNSVSKIMFRENQGDKEYFDFPILKRSEKTLKGSADKETLNELLSSKLKEDHKEFLETLLKSRAIKKLFTTYIENLPNATDEFWVYRPSYNIVGATTGRMCLVGETKILLFDGTEKRLDELEKGGEYWIYGVNLQGNVVISKSINLGITKYVNELLEITLDNNEIIKCTPDHRFMLQDGSYKEAQYLTPDDNLMSLYRRLDNIGYDNDQKLKYTNRISVCKYGMKDDMSDKHLVYHKILSKEIINCESLTPVYDLSVPNIHNFALSAGVFVHNSSGFHVLPKKSDIKRLYISRWAGQGGTILASDESQLELRVLASVAKEEKWVESYRKGFDQHQTTGAIIYGVPPEEATKEMRRIGKITNFAIVYGKTLQNLSGDLDMTIPETQKVMDNLLSGSSGLNNFIKSQNKFVLENKFVVTPFGRVFIIQEAYSDKHQDKERAKRLSVNYVVQSAASDIVVSTIVDIMTTEKLKSLFIGTVHDSILLDIYPGELFKVVSIMKYAAEVAQHKKYEWLTCPLELDIALGTSWGNALDVKFDSYDRESINCIMKGKRKDILLLISELNKGYATKYTILGETPTEDENDIDFVRDSVTWDIKLNITKF